MTVSCISSNMPADIASTISHDVRPWWNKNVLEWFSSHNWTVSRLAMRFDCLPKTITRHAGRLNVEFEESATDSNPKFGGYRNAVYVLQLSGENYYVGMSQKCSSRLEEHFSGDGSLWTDKYPPQRFHKIERYPSASRDFLLERERELTLELMKQYGWQSVRGGPWATPNLEHPPSELWCERDDWPKQEWLTEYQDTQSNPDMDNLHNIANSL